MSDNNVISIRRRPIWNDRFEPPPMTILLTLRKHMGLTIEEAASVLHVSVKTLEHEESCGYPPLLNDLDAVLMRYLYFLSVHGNARPRNLIKNHYSLCDVRCNVFNLDLASMGSRYGGYTARQWHFFEIHEDILDRSLLAQIQTDLREHDHLYRYM